MIRITAPSGVFTGFTSTRVDAMADMGKNENNSNDISVNNRIIVELECDVFWFIGSKIKHSV